MREVPEFENVIIAEQILAMSQQDQDMRARAAANRGVNETKEDNAVDVKNTNQLKKIVAEIGWPTVSKVGEKAATMAWLLVQHADHDVAWQQQCLALMKEQPIEEVSQEDIAYLEDRVNVNDGRPQIYGTQFFDEGVNYRPRPIEDPDHVDDRRKKMGTEPLAEYTWELKDKYGEK